MSKLRIASLLLPLFVFGCTAEATSDPVPANKPATPPAKVAATVVHDVKCGCSIEGVGRCGNFVMIEGKYVPLIHPSLGKMEFCKQKDAGAKIETAGKMLDGKFVAEHWKLVE